MEAKEISYRCELCIHSSYDSEDDSLECEAALDEDDMLRFMTKQKFDCPYFQLNDEYKRVRKQN